MTVAAFQSTPVPFDDVVYWAEMEGLTRAQVAAKVTPLAIAQNTGRIYEWMEGIGLAAESTTREALFAFASHAFGVDYDVFYDAWLAERPVGEFVSI